jgi:diguanylate cyclase (GGDEF)-like protein
VPVKNKGNGKWVFYLARRINGRNNEFLGLVLVGVSVEVFSSLYERIGGNLGEGSAISLYRIDKTLLTRWPLVENLIGQVNTNGLIDESLSHASDNGGVIFSSGAGFVRQNTAPVERMISYRKVTNYPFIVGAVVPESIYLANWYRNTAGVFLATGFSLLALLIGATFLLKIYRRNAYNQYRAHYDSLTGLPNRLLFGDRLQLAVANCKRNGDKLAVLFIDLDNLKCINDVNGHAAGDFVLKEIASRMRSCLRAVDTVGRLGGDEFLVILPGVDSEASAIKIAEKIRHSICQPLAFEGQEICTSPSIGICFYPDHGQDEMELINNADMAMYEAKVSGRNAIKVFSEGVLQASLRDLA